MNTKTLIGKYVLLSEPELVVADFEFPAQRPILIESITECHNVAGYIVNNKYIISYHWISNLVNKVNIQNDTKG